MGWQPINRGRPLRLREGGTIPAMFESLQGINHHYTIYGSAILIPSRSAIPLITRRDVGGYARTPKREGVTTLAGYVTPRVVGVDSLINGPYRLIDI